MKRFSSPSVRYDSGPNMTPLVDVVMVILIFLMLAGGFGSAEHFLSSKGNVVVKGPVTTPDTRPIVVTPTVDVYLRDAADGGFVARLGGTEFRDADALQRSLDTIFRQHAGAGVPPETVQVILHPTTTARWDSVAGVYDSTLRAGFSKVAFAYAQ